MTQQLTHTEARYFDRHLQLAGFGLEAQERLKAARVLVVGAGGLGCPVLQYLATAGAGNISVIDADTVSYHNLHRQVLFTPHDVGKNKATTAVRRLAAQQPFVQFTAYAERLSPANALLLVGTHDLVIDGTDNFETRYLVNDACVIQNVPFVSGAIDRYTGQVSVFNYQGGPTYRCLYPEPPGECGSCARDGVLNVLPGIIGTLMANEALKVLGGYGELLVGKLLLVDIRGNGYQQFSFSAVEENRHIQALQATYAREEADEVPIEAAHMAEPEVPSAGALLVDVREAWEYEEGHVDDHINIPIYQLPHRAAEWADNARPVLFYCTTGKRSRMAVEVARERGVTAYAKRLR
ncbi:ThiF family adenylyltransferase [Parapedobacter deserti]|uniref:ThiF family adenylyltransferase n=1 Tax=Parapedobacter deserti TaxID=1912957 RepID=A0ABV7JMZ9_9SPHI